MLANLITTILLALGVATNNVSSNVYKGGNAFNNETKIEDKKTIKRATISNSYYCEWTNEAEYNDTNTKYWSYKQYLMEGQSTDTENQGRAVLFEPFLIENTAYTISYINVDNNRWTYNYIILKFTNYTNAVQTLTLNSRISLQNASNHAYIKKTVYETTDTTLDQAIDLTLNASTQATIRNIFQNTEATIIYNYDYWWHPNTSTIDVVIESPQITLEEASTKYIILYTEFLSEGQDNYGWAFNRNLTIEGVYNQKEYTQEIVDIPNLIFTILTMPFAWFSTAFNLTIFPGTPYAVNFGNIILTMIAALTLLYLIRKILK